MNPALATPLVDCHAHVYTRSMPVSGSAWHIPPQDATIEDYIRTLDAHGVHFAVLAAASIYGDYNDYALAAVAQSRRLRTTVIVNPDIDFETMKRMDAQGVVGIRFQFRNVATPPDLRSFEYRRLMRRAADLGWHIHLHDEGPRLAKFIQPILEAGPRLVIDHFGRPDPAEGGRAESFQRILKAVEEGRTWVKISAPFRLASVDLATSLTADLLKARGPDRLLWGSDWPFAAFEDSVTYQQVLDTYTAVIPDETIRRAIDRTALKFYFS